MDASDPEISFDDGGVCNHCRSFDDAVAAWRRSAPSLDEVVERIKSAGRGREYDCLLGVSGGVDSSFLAYKARELGLRPLTIHLDNGWDSELAIQNIENVVTKLDLDLYTHVVDWAEFSDLQRSFLKASVIDVEMVTDHAIVALAYAQARQHGVPVILSGNNLATEGILPRAWVHQKTDLRNLKAIHRRFGTVRLKTFPQTSTLRIRALQRFRGIRSIDLLNYLPYSKADALATLETELGWRAYGGKHHESLFTRFYQTYILPRKFGVDKRRAHLSSLIVSGQMARGDALAELESPPANETTLASDREYVTKKLGFTEPEFERLMQESPRPHRAFPSEQSYLDRLVTIKGVLRRAA